MNLSTVAPKPEELNKGTWVDPYYSIVSVVGSLTLTTNPGTRNLQLNVPSAVTSSYELQSV